MKADILGGKIKPSEGGKSGPKVPAGDFDVVVESASFGGGFKNPQSMRGVVEFKVTKVHSLLDESGNPDAIVGGTFKRYYQTKNMEYAQELVACGVKMLQANGISVDSVFEDAETVVDIMENLMTKLNKASRKTSIKVKINRKPSNEPDRFYFNVLEYYGTAKEEAKPVASPEPVTQEAPVAAEDWA
jgi:hypothetical protein